MTTLRNRRRPPRDPSAAASKPMSALEKQQQQPPLSFRKKVQQANANSICNATSDKLGRMTMHKLLVMDLFCVPIFQRRYCWNTTQWKTLLDDAAVGGHPKHSLGRLTCTSTTATSKSSHLLGVLGRSCILDGQQRFTTTTILLAAIRDAWHQLQGDTGTVATIHQILFSNVNQMKEWMETKEPLREGMELPFARLIPTFCDRRAYYRAILPPSNYSDFLSEDSSQPLPRPLQAKEFFLQQIQSRHCTLPKLTKLLRGVLDGLTMLYFPIDVDDNHENDGTNDMMVIYERLALRDATFCKPTRKEEYQSMTGSDMIRNLLLGSFADDTGSAKYYNEYWLPLEQEIARRNDGRTMPKVLQAFLEAPQNTIGTIREAKAGHVVGGQIYAQFQAWFAVRLAGDEGREMDGSIDEKVRQIGRELLDFARETSGTKPPLGCTPCVPL